MVHVSGHTTRQPFGGNLERANVRSRQINEGIMNPRLRGQASNYTAGRETWRPEFEQIGNGAMRMNVPKRRQENIPYSAGRMMPGDLSAKKFWEAQHAPESLESIGGGTLGDWKNQASFYNPSGIVNSGVNMPREWQVADASPMSFKMWDAMRQRLGRPPDVTGEPTIQAIPIGPESSLGEQWAETAELGLPQPMDWQTDPYEKLSLDELIGLGASEEQIAAYLGLA